MNQVFAPAPDRADSALVRIDLGNCSAPILYYEDPPATVDLQVAAAAGAWETVAVFDGQHTRDTAPGAMFVCGTPATNAEGRLEFDIMHNVDQELYAVRVAARLADGREAGLVLHTPRGGLPKKGIVIGTLPTDCPLSQVREYVLQRLPWARAAIRGIALRPTEARADSTFNPAIEVTLSDSALQPEALDLDTGRKVPLDRDLDSWPEEQQARWIKKSGIGLFVNSAPWRLLTPGANAVRLVLVTNTAWAAMDREQIERELIRGYAGVPVESIPQVTVYHLGTNPPPLTFAFATANGNRGLLQITGFTENPPGVKIRYKLAQSAKTNTPVQPSAAF